MLTQNHLLQVPRHGWLIGTCVLRGRIFPVHCDICTISYIIPTIRQTTDITSNPNMCKGKRAIEIAGQGIRIGIVMIISSIETSQWKSPIPRYFQEEYHFSFPQILYKCGRLPVTVRGTSPILAGELHATPGGLSAVAAVQHVQPMGRKTGNVQLRSCQTPAMKLEAWA